MTRERISRILELRELLLSFQTGFPFYGSKMAKLRDIAAELFCGEQTPSLSKVLGFGLNTVLSDIRRNISQKKKMPIEQCKMLNLI